MADQYGAKQSLCSSLASSPTPEEDLQAALKVRVGMSVCVCVVVGGRLRHHAFAHALEIHGTRHILARVWRASSQAFGAWAFPKCVSTVHSYTHTHTRAHPHTHANAHTRA